MLNNYICALDIGSSKIAASVAEVRRKRITNIFFESLPSKGIKRGEIIDSVEVVNSVGRVLRNLKAKSGIKIKSVYVSISGKDILTKHSCAVIPLAERGNKVISLSDIEKVNDQARILGSSLEEEIVHAIPFGYAIDSNAEILNPLGLYSHKLEVDLYLVCAKLPTLQSLVRVINQAGYELKDLCLSGIATSNAVFNDEFKEGVSVLCDIGSDITEFLIFNNGLLKEIKISSIGGNNLTEELSEVLKIPFDLAEDVKRSYGIVGDCSHIKEDKEILLKKDELYRPIKHKLVAEIVTAKAKDICQALKDTLKGIIPGNEINNFIVSGRTVLQEGFLERLENVLGIPVKIARINHPHITSLINKDNAIAISGRKYLTYITSLGIICQALYNQEPRFKPTPEPSGNPFSKIINRFKEVYQEYF